MVIINEGSPGCITSQIAKFMGPTWVLSAPDGPHVSPMNLAIRDCMTEEACTAYHIIYKYHIDILVQDCSNFIALAMELLQSYTKS